MVKDKLVCSIQELFQYFLIIPNRYNTCSNLSYCQQIATAFSVTNFQTAQGGDRPQVWVFGTSIFLGWAALILGFVGGLVMWCGSYVDEVSTLCVHTSLQAKRMC